MSYIYENELFCNIFEILESKYPESNITTAALVKEEGKNNYDSKTLQIIKNLDDDYFFDINSKKAYNHKDFYKKYNIRIANAHDYKLIYGF